MCASLPTFLFVAAKLVVQPVALRRRSHHEGEAHEQRCILGQRPVSLYITGPIRKLCSTAGGVAQADPLLSWERGGRHTRVKIP